MRLHLLGPLPELDRPSVAEARTVRVVQAETAAAARRSAIVEAERDLAALVGRPIVESLVWSTDDVDRDAPEPGELVGRFDFDEGPAPGLPEALDDLTRALAGNDLRLMVGAGWLSVQSEEIDGYAVSIDAEDDGFTVETEDWHGHYDDPEQAVACFRWLLTPFYRTVVETQGDRPSASWIERYGADGWEPMDQVLFRNPGDPTQWLGGGWVRTTVQQALLRPPVSYDEIVPGARVDEDGLPFGSLLGQKTETFPRPHAEAMGWLEGEYEFDPGGPED